MPDHSTEDVAEAGINKGAAAKINSDQQQQSKVNINSYAHMVRWFSPRLLTRAAYRDAVAGVFGQFADQRIIQSLSDSKLEDAGREAALATRYDYSHEPMKDGKFWLDYVADLGDGFDSTFSVATLLAADELQGAGNEPVNGVAGVKRLASDQRLDHGRIMIFGGDQVYPWPTWDAYHDRLEIPYKLALPSDNAAAEHAPGTTTRRNVYAIPGNHDWYDGLTAFDNLFCRSRNGRAGDCGTEIGGWHSRQHRSYFALKLPNGWWVWAADIQLASYLDQGQLSYFNTIAQQMDKDDRFILCTAQPSWYETGSKNEEFARQNLGKLIEPAVQRGIKLCSILSGDWHHYARYNESESLGNFNLFTVGGGGAYLHGTGHLRKELSFFWIDRILKFRLDRKLKPRPKKTKDGETQPPVETTQSACYPSKSQSNRLVWRNLAFPVKNFSFSLGIGLIYWMFAWMFSALFAIINVNYSLTPMANQTVIDGVDGSFNKDTGFFTGDGLLETWIVHAFKLFNSQFSDSSDPISPLWAFSSFVLESIQLFLFAIGNSPAAFILLMGLWALLVTIVDTRTCYGKRKGLFKFIAGTLHFYAHVTAMWVIQIVTVYLLIGIQDPITHERQGGMLMSYLSSLDGNEVLGLVLTSTVVTYILIAIVVVILGTIIGGFIFGVYLILTNLLAGANADWAFSAIRNDNYKCFLRLCFEKDRVTVYPIALKKVASRRKWYWLRRSGWVWRQDPASGQDRLRPRVPLKPELIEGPIVIAKDAVANLPRGQAPVARIPRPHMKNRKQ